jgi:hypothetical protein
LFKNKKFRATSRSGEPQHDQGADLIEKEERRYLQANNEYANKLNVLDDNKTGPSADKVVDKIEQRDNSNKHVDKQNKKESKTQSPPLVIYTHTKSIAWTTSQLMVLYSELDMQTRSIGIFLL